MKLNKHQSGQSLVEFALLFPLVIFLLAGFFDLSRAVFYYSSLTNAVREGTRYTIVHKDLDENSIKEKVIEYAFALQNTPDPLTKDNIAISYPTVQNEEKITVSVKATYTFKPVTPGIKFIFGNSSGIDLVAQSTMRISGASR